MTDNAPVQILEEDFSQVEAVFKRLRSEGITDLFAYLATRPTLPRKWLGLLRLTEANRPAVEEAGFAGKAEMRAQFPRHVAAPYLEIFSRQITALWAGRTRFEDEFRYLDPQGRERACLMQCQIGKTDGQPDFSRVMLVLLDVTTAKRTAAAQMESQDLMRGILAGANILLWWAQVRRESGYLAWKVNVPSQSYDSPLCRLATAIDRGGLWDSEHVPALAELTERSTRAILDGSRGYQHEFQVNSGDGTAHWVMEEVAISRVGGDEWSLVGVITDVTARHVAEAEKQRTQMQLEQILSQADCMLWQARLEGPAGRSRCCYEVLPSELQKRIFGETGERIFDRITRSPLAVVYKGYEIPELREMEERCEAAIRDNKASFEHEFRLIRGGAILWLREHISLTREGPERLLLSGMAIDISARKLAEQAIRVSEQRYRLMFELSPHPLWVIDRATLQFLAANAAATQTYGYTREEFLAMSALDIRPPEEHERFRRAIAELKEDEAMRGGLWRHRTKDGRIIDVEVGRSLLELDGRPAFMSFMRDVTEERRAQMAVRESEARYRDLFESAVEGVYQLSPDGQFLGANSSLARIFGSATPEEFMAWSKGGAKLIYVRPGRQEEFYAELGARDSVTNFESEVRRRDGSRIWIRENVRAVRAPDGRILYLQGFVSDVTQQRQAIEALRDSEARYRSMLGHIPVAVVELDLEDTGRRLRELHAAGVKDLAAHLAKSPPLLGELLRSIRVVTVNDTAVQLFKAESRENFQDEIGRLLTPDLGEVVRELLDSVWHGKNDGDAEAETADFYGNRHDSYLRWWMPRQEKRLVLEHAVVAIVDLTELKRAEAALAAEKERLTVTLRAMSEGVITADLQGVVQFMNRAAEDLTDRKGDAAIGRPLEEVLHLMSERSGQAVTLPAARVISEGATVELQPRTLLVRPEGSSFLVEGCCAPIHEAGGLLVGTVTVVRDVTMRQRLEEELERASRLESIGILAGGIAHDFNNILTAILGNITLAQLDAEALTTVEGYLREAERATLRARDLTQQLLTFSKGGDPVRSAVLLPEIVIEITQFALHGSRVKCEFQLPENLWPVDADKGQLSQVIQNLVINAVQAMPEGGTVRISATNEALATDSRHPVEPGDYVRIAVADSGMGIRPENLEKVFDPYFTTKHQGTGLGLTTVYSIVRKHQGHIEVESEIGKGTTFRLWLPAMREQQLDFPADDRGSDEPMHGRVLLMDDDEAILGVARTLLPRLGFEVELAHEGAEAVEKYVAARDAGRPFDVVVMDLTVPGGLGGWEATQQLHKIDPSVRAIVSSGYSSDPVLANYRAYGFKGVVAKPYKVDDFAQVLRAVLREGRGI